MGYFNMSVRVEEYVEVELDTDEVLGNMDQSDILDYVTSNISAEEVLDGMDRDEVQEYVLSRMDAHTILERSFAYLDIAKVLRAIADKLDNT